MGSISSLRSRTMMAAVVLGTALTSGASTAATPAADERSTTTVGDLAKYCQTCWRNARLPADRWPDCTQQVFVRLLERVEPNRWPELLKSEGMDKRELLRAIDAVKKRTQRSRRLADLTVEYADPRTNSDTNVHEQWEAVNKAATQVLSPRQQRIVRLSADGWDVPEIAEELGTTPERVSDEKYKAIRKLRDHLNID